MQKKNIFAISVIQ